MWNAGVIALLGVWMILAPFLLPNRDFGIWNTRVVGVIVAALGIGFPRAHTPALFAATAVGVWLISSTFLQRMLGPNGVPLNAIASGMALLLAGVTGTRKTAS